MSQESIWIVLALSVGSPSVRAAETILVCTSSSGVLGNNTSSEGALSSDGRYVAFASEATNLGFVENNTQADVFLKDLVTGSIALISRNAAGGTAAGLSSSPDLSADGRFLVFASKATDLPGVPLNPTFYSLVLYDRVLDTYQPAVVGLGGQMPNGGTLSFRMTSDGRFLAFVSQASNLTADDTTADLDVFLRDLTTGANRLVSVGANGENGTSSSNKPAPSLDGTLVAFATASPFAPFDVNLVDDIYVKNMVTGAITRESKNSSGLPATGFSTHPSLSDDGRFLCFESGAANLVPGDSANGGIDVFVRELRLGITTCASVSSTGTILNIDAAYSEISGDGERVVFRTFGTNFIWPGLTLEAQTVLHERKSGTTVPVSSIPTGTSASAFGNDKSFPVDLTRDGRFVAIWSFATNLVPGDTNGKPDVFRVELGDFGDVGYGSTGPAGAPRFSVEGTLTPGANGALHLESATPLSPALLFASVAFAPAVTPIGTLVCDLPVAAFPFVTDASGRIDLPYVAPPQPPGIDAAFLQVAVATPVTVPEIRLSNGLVGWW